jgi:signal transduction histidine kinase
MRRTSPQAARSAAAGKSAPDFRALAMHVLDGQSSERAKLSRFLHDEIASLLSGAGIQLDILRMDLEDGAPRLATRAAGILEILESVMTKVRVLSYDLNPGIVERAGLRPALERLVSRHRAEFRGGLRLRMDATLRVAPGAAAAVFQIAEQAVANAVQHSDGDRIDLTLRRSAAGAILQVRDNGRGFHVAAEHAAPRGIGMMVMEQYALQAGVSLDVRSAPGRGTVVRVVAPQDTLHPNGRPDGIQRIVSGRSQNHARGRADAPRAQRRLPRGR